MAYIKRKGVWRPTTVPTFPVEINWNHPLADGLVGLYLPGAHGFSDLAAIGPSLTPRSAVGIGGTALGPASLHTALQSGLTSSTVPASWKNNSGSLFWAGQFNSNPNANAMIWGLEYNSADGSPYACYELYCGSNGLAPNGLFNIAGAIKDMGTSTTAFTVGRPSTLLLTFDFVNSGNTYIAQNGVQTLTKNFGTGAISFSGPPLVCLGGDLANAASLKMNGLTALAIIYDYPLLSGLWGYINAEPFAMLQPKAQRIWYVPASGGQMAGTSAAAASSAGNLEASGTFAGVSNAKAASGGILKGQGALSANSGASSSTTGLLEGSGALAGVSEANSGASGTITARTGLAGASDATSGATGELAGSGSIGGASRAISGASGKLQQPAGMAGASDAVSSAGGMLLATGTIKGASASLSSASGFLRGSGTFSGTAKAASNASGALFGRGDVAAAAHSISTATGLPVGSGKMAGTSAAIGGATGTFGHLGVMAGASNATGFASGILGGSKLFESIRLESVTLTAPGISNVTLAIPTIQVDGFE